MYINDALQIIADALDIDKEAINIDSRIEDIEEWDSLSHIQIIAEIEEHFGITIPIEAVSQIKTIRDIIKYIKR